MNLKVLRSIMESSLESLNPPTSGACDTQRLYEYDISDASILPLETPESIRQPLLLRAGVSPHFPPYQTKNKVKPNLVAFV